MGIEGVKLDCHNCSKSIYINKDIVGLLICCPFCFDPDIVVYNYVRIYIEKPIDEEDR